MVVRDLCCQLTGDRSIVSLYRSGIDLGCSYFQCRRNSVVCGVGTSVCCSELDEGFGLVQTVG